MPRGRISDELREPLSPPVAAEEDDQAAAHESRSISFRVSALSAGKNGLVWMFGRRSLTPLLFPNVPYSLTMALQEAGGVAAAVTLPEAIYNHSKLFGGCSTPSHVERGTAWAKAIKAISVNGLFVVTNYAAWQAFGPSFQALNAANWGGTTAVALATGAWDAALCGLADVTLDVVISGVAGRLGYHSEQSWHDWWLDRGANAAEILAFTVAEVLLAQGGRTLGWEIPFSSCKGKGTFWCNQFGNDSDILQFGGIVGVMLAVNLACRRLRPICAPRSSTVTEVSDADETLTDDVATSEGAALSSVDYHPAPVFVEDDDAEYGYGSSWCSCWFGRGSHTSNEVAVDAAL